MRRLPPLKDAHRRLLPGARVVGDPARDVLEFVMKLLGEARTPSFARSRDGADRPAERLPRAEQDDRLAQARGGPGARVDVSHPLVRAARDPAPLERDGEGEPAGLEQRLSAFR